MGTLRDDLVKIVKQRELNKKQKRQTQVSSSIDRICKWIRDGKMTIPNVGNDLHTQSEIKKFLNKEGFTVEFFTSEIESKTQKSRLGKRFEIPSYQVTNLRIGLK